MRPALRIRALVCLDCRLRQFQHVRRRFQSNVTEAQHTSQTIDLSTSLPFDVSKNTQKSRTRPHSQSKSKVRSSITTQSQDEAIPITDDAQVVISASTDNVVFNEEAALSLPEQFCLSVIVQLRQKLEAGYQRLQAGVASGKHSKTGAKGLSFEDAVKATKDIADSGGLEKDTLKLLKKSFAGQRFSKFMKDTRRVQAQDPEVRRNLLHKLGIGEQELDDISSKIHMALSRRRERRLSQGRPVQMANTTKLSGVADKNSPLMDPNLGTRAVSKPVPVEDLECENPAPGLQEIKRPIPKLDSTQSRLLRESDVEMKPLPMDAPTVPNLSFDLSRVLFNPGVYQLQDPRSRVFNFSPYLQRLLPVSQFNFDALNEYITSSKDQNLRELALKHQKKYQGSSSSMTGLLTHFHFLLSAWRPINVKTLSQSFSDPLRSFTQFQRGPSVIFLRWKDGIYAVDADKEYDSANILMSLGKSMEKLLTLEEEEFERYRKSAQEEGVPLPVTAPEVYHYTELGDFLLRSQLDAHDSRLPGTGMFDLKTRAVVSIRMNVRDHESVMGYEIQNRFGDIESYEKEYFDMIRSAFLKYSLQVRMGRMDGIFVAYHNIERIFGFQYISLPEMDLHLHGTGKRSIGDTEFKLSLGLLNEIFNKVTTKMPETSLRFHFETRDSVGAEGNYMYIFAEAQTEEDIEDIQNTKKAEIAEFEARILNASEDEGKVLTDKVNTISDPLLDDLKSAKFSQPAAGKLMGFTLRILNKVNGQSALRPYDLDESDSWDVEYTLEEMPHDQALKTYNQCRGRRSRLQKSTQRDDAAADFYLRKMQGLAENGRSVRRQIDQRDAGKPVVVLDRVL